MKLYDAAFVFVFMVSTVPWANSNPSWFEHWPSSVHQTLEKCEARKNANLGWGYGHECVRQTLEFARKASARHFPTIPPDMALGIEDWNEAKWCEHNASRGWCENGKIVR